MDRRRIAAAIVLCGLAATWASAHPSSGIVVTQTGHVLFTDNGGDGFLWRVSPEGTLTLIQRERLQGLHWLALAEKVRYSREQLDRLHLQRASIPDSTATLLKTDANPIVVDGAGTLYFAKGNVEVAHVQPDGTVGVLGPTSKDVTAKFGGWVTGLATGPDGSVYVACTTAVLKIAPDGMVTTIADSIALREVTTEVPADAGDRDPSLSGLTVDAAGTAYVAATGSRRCVVRITAAGRVEKAFESERPWSPTGVAARGRDIYVLEYANADQEYAEWLPRVRKLGPDGVVTTLITISKKNRER